MWLENILHGFPAFIRQRCDWLPRQKKEQALNGPGEPFLAYVHLVAHPVGKSLSGKQRRPLPVLGFQPRDIQGWQVGIEAMKQGQSLV